MEPRRHASIEEASAQGVALLAELIAALALIVTLLGFRARRSQFWLAASIIALIAFMAAATIVVSSTA